MSDKKSRQILRRAKQINKNSILVVTGCYAQSSKEELEKIKEIDIILGNSEKNDILKYVEEFKLNKDNTINHINDIMKEKEFLELGATLYTEKTRAVIKVQDGCDRYCSYCIIPYVRGKVRSRSIENILEEIEQIVQNGVKEIVITGIHIASYGKDFKEDISLIDLLEKINEIKGLKRIRLGSLEPTIITKDFVDRLKNLSKVCHHFHLSLQSGCNETLKRMNRKYTVEEFKKVVNLLRDTYKDVILTTDIIVGFPKETDKEFEATYNFLKEISFYKMHIFKYSKRAGTKAAQMEEQVDGNIKEIRSNKLIELSNQNEAEYNKSFIGKEYDVLFEEIDGKYIKGHTADFLMVKVPNKSGELEENEIYRVIIKEIMENEIIGEIK